MPLKRFRDAIAFEARCKGTSTRLCILINEDGGRARMANLRSAGQNQPVLRAILTRMMHAPGQPPQRQQKEPCASLGALWCVEPSTSAFYPLPPVLFAHTVNAQNPIQPNFPVTVGRYGHWI